MKIVLVGPFGLQPKGTMSVRALPLAKALAERGHTVTVVIPPWDDPARSGQSWVEAGVSVVNLPLPGPGLGRLPLLFHLLLTWRLVRAVMALQPEVVQLFKPKAYAGLTHLALWGRRRLKNWAARLIVDIDDWEQAWNDLLPYPWLLKKFFAWQEQWGLTHADAVTAASRALVELATGAGVNRSRLFYLPNGSREAEIVGAEVSRSAFSLPTILLYTRFAEYRLERIVTLVGLVAAQMPQARWLVVGRGFLGEERALAARLAQAGLADWVEFTGWPPDRPLAACLAAADVAVHPYDDTLLNRTKCSVKLIELLAAGLPVVADAVGQNTEYIQDGVSGVLTPAEDDAAMAAALVELLQSPARRQAMGQAAIRHTRRNYTWPKLLESVAEVYT